MYILKTDFQYTDNNSGTIFILKPGVEFNYLDKMNYIFKHGRKEYKIQKSILENNPTFFEMVNFEVLLIDLLKKINTKSYKKKAEDIIELIDDNYIGDREIVDKTALKTTLKACLCQYQTTNDSEWLKPIDDLGYTIDDDGDIIKK